ncbi:MAG: hypothetical protein ACR2PV_07925 [Gammaproteobacteria bacterium]
MTETADITKPETCAAQRRARRKKIECGSSGLQRLLPKCRQWIVRST